MKLKRKVQVEDGPSDIDIEHNRKKPNTASTLPVSK